MTFGFPCAVKFLLVISGCGGLGAALLGAAPRPGNKVTLVLPPVRGKADAVFAVDLLGLTLLDD